ncbi:HET-domain-containing protein [Aspergillus eucalypticola CBS 122712]|uniref:HET-domain-containing protein n=1 Tax=Aspergillus eucalypticola (strain CBS 122712 / IBT 29274) TaxID=1448314 RepID=A0A317V7V5_ASPEC|nr:HET-domain-containing protein [Aspergillus eucalypticola CBS 122712]PWY68932.1 HET-domain-containing protein [Aspergillus eucalypticola CBS 122712]
MSSTREQVANIINSPFIYSLLPPEPNITRMIRLLPNRDNGAPIQCELFNYNLSQSDEEHLYEALSYVWGSQDRSRSIILDGYMLPVTENLHTALLHLRSKQLERILWIDGISINQDDDGEKSKQIPLMRMIYAQARRVVVWLGDGKEYGDKALKVLGSLGRKRKSEPINERDREQCEKLLQRDWFRRIWVLQEVGVAQYISIMCGSVQVNGHIFCEGLDNLKPSSALMAKISPVSFLIKEALFRSHDGHLSDPTLSIGELVSMYRNHNATKQHDKVYALLGLSADSDSAALVPDYKLPWHEVFRQVTQHVFPRCSVEICYGSETAIVKGKGWILGYIYSISDSFKDSQQTFRVVFNQICQRLGYHDRWEAEWSLQASGELLQDGDIVCLLEGQSQPSILRLCVDYYTVVTPVVKPKQQAQNTEDNVTVGESCSAHGLCDIILGWKVSQSEDKAESTNLLRLVEIAPNYYKKHCIDERSLNHTTSAMIDAAMQSLQLGVSGKRALDNVISEGRVKGVHTDSRLSQSDVKVSQGLITAINTALWQEHENPYAWKKVLALAVQDTQLHGYSIASILLQRLREMILVSEEVAKAAAANQGAYAHRIMGQLLEHHGDRLPVSEEVVKAAAANQGAYAHRIMEQLLEYHGDRLPVSEEVVKAAVANENIYAFKIMGQLLEHHGDRLLVSEEMVKAAAANQGAYAYRIMGQLLEYRGDRLPVSEEVVKAAAANQGVYAPEIMEQLLKYHGDRLPVSEEMLKAAAANKGAYAHRIMEQLLEHHGDRLPVSEEVIRVAAANQGGYAPEIMEQLLEHKWK